MRSFLVLGSMMRVCCVSFFMRMQHVDLRSFSRWLNGRMRTATLTLSPMDALKGCQGVKGEGGKGVWSSSDSRDRK